MVWKVDEATDLLIVNMFNMYYVKTTERIEKAKSEVYMHKGDIERIEISLPNIKKKLDEQYEQFEEMKEKFEGKNEKKISRSNKIVLDNMQKGVETLEARLSKILKDIEEKKVLIQTRENSIKKYKIFLDTLDKKYKIFTSKVNGVMFSLSEKYEARYKTPINLIGPPGQGKSTAVYTAANIFADLMGMEVIRDPTDLSKLRDYHFVLVNSAIAGATSGMEVGGIPSAEKAKIVDTSAPVGSKEEEVTITQKIPIVSFQALSQATAGILLFDDFTTGHSNVQNACMSIILEGKMQNIDLNSSYVVATSNKGAKDGNNTTPLTSSLANRFQHLEVETKWEEFNNYMKGKDSHQSEVVTSCISMFMDSTKGDLLQGAPRKQEAYATSRSWEGVANLLHGEFKFLANTDVSSLHNLLSQNLNLDGKGLANTAICLQIGKLAGTLVGVDAGNKFAQFTYELLTSAVPIANASVLSVEENKEIRELAMQVFIKKYLSNACRTDLGEEKCSLLENLKNKNSFDYAKNYETQIGVETDYFGHSFSNSLAIRLVGEMKGIDPRKEEDQGKLGRLLEASAPFINVLNDTDFSNFLSKIYYHSLNMLDEPFVKISENDFGSTRSLNQNFTSGIATKVGEYLVLPFKDKNNQKLDDRIKSLAMAQNSFIGQKNVVSSLNAMDEDLSENMESIESSIQRVRARFKLDPIQNDENTPS